MVSSIGGVMKLQEAKLSWRWWALSFRGICLLMAPTSSDSASQIFDHLVRRKRNVSPLLKGLTVIGSMTSLARAAVQPPKVKVVREAVIGSRRLQALPEVNAAVSSACFQSFWVFMRCHIWTFICSYLSWKYWQWIQHFIKLSADLGAPPSPLASPLSCPSLLPSSFCRGVGRRFWGLVLRGPVHPGLLLYNLTPRRPAGWIRPSLGFRF